MEQLCRLLFISLLFVSACAGGGSPSRCLLERADSLLDVRPDSALRLLQGVSPRQLADRGATRWRVSWCPTMPMRAMPGCRRVPITTWVVCTKTAKSRTSPSKRTMKQAGRHDGRATRGPCAGRITTWHTSA